MRIAYDYEIFWKQREYGGISRYFSNLIKYNYKNKSLKLKVFSQLYFNEYLKTLPKELISGKKINYIPPYSGRLFEFYTKKISNLKLLNFKPDIIHRTLFSNNFSTKKNSKVVITIYDLIHEIFSQDKIFRPKQKAINLADKIICSGPMYMELHTKAKFPKRILANGPNLRFEDIHIKKKAMLI